MKKIELQARRQNPVFKAC